MNRVLSTHLIANHRLTPEWLQSVLDAGIPAVEIFCVRQHLDYRDKGQIAELGRWFRDSDLQLHSLHSPMFSDDQWGRTGPDSWLNITHPVKSERVRIVDEIKRAIEVAESIPFKYLIQHIGHGPEEYDERKVDTAFNSLDELSLFARQRGVQILLENIPNEMSTATRLRQFLDATHLDLYFVFDTGHAHIGAGVEHEFEIMQDRVRSLHIHDNDGASDLHLFPFSDKGGTIDWERAMHLIRAHPNQYPLLLELKEVAGMTNPLDRVNAVFDRLETV